MIMKSVHSKCSSRLQYTIDEIIIRYHSLTLGLDHIQTTFRPSLGTILARHELRLVEVLHITCLRSAY